LKPACCDSNQRRGPTTILISGKGLLIATIPLISVLEGDASHLLSIDTHAAGPSGALPLSPEMLLTEPSGNLFGLTQNAGMGW